jgi:hypothetical protein
MFTVFELLDDHVPNYGIDYFEINEESNYVFTQTVTIKFINFFMANGNIHPNNKKFGCSVTLSKKIYQLVRNFLKDNINICFKINDKVLSNQVVTLKDYNFFQLTSSGLFPIVLYKFGVRCEQHATQIFQTIEVEKIAYLPKISEHGGNSNDLQTNKNEQQHSLQTEQFKSQESQKQQTTNNSNHSDKDNIINGIEGDKSNTINNIEVKNEQTKYVNRVDNSHSNRHRTFVSNRNKNYFRKYSNNQYYTGNYYYNKTKNNRKYKKTVAVEV